MWTKRAGNQQATTRESKMSVVILLLHTFRAEVATLEHANGRQLSAVWARTTDSPIGFCLEIHRCRAVGGVPRPFLLMRPTRASTYTIQASCTFLIFFTRAAAREDCPPFYVLLSYSSGYGSREGWDKRAKLGEVRFFSLEYPLLSRVRYSQLLNFCSCSAHYKHFLCPSVFVCFFLDLQERGLVHDAMQCYQTAIKLRPDFAIAYGNLASCYYDCG